MREEPPLFNGMIAEYRSKFAALNFQWWRLHMSEKFWSGNPNVLFFFTEHGLRGGQFIKKFILKVLTCKYGETFASITLQTIS